MLNQTETRAATEALRAAAHALEWLEASSDSAHRRELLSIATEAKYLLRDLEMLARKVGFHPETDDVDGYDPTDDANAIAESGEDDADYY